MPYETDERLKGFLDTNQLAREQMSLAIMRLDKRFSEVRPRHPRGGPDGGRDLEATFRGTHRAFGAVGFVNQADDSPEKKKRAREKFHLDLATALSNTPKPEVFVFITNVNFSVSEKEHLVQEAQRADFVYCEVFDRERLRIALDSPDGFAARYQYLQIPLSEAEQAAFFARWGDDIQSLISSGFQDLHRTLNRLLFLQESTISLSEFSVEFELDRIFSAEEIGHFRAFYELHFKERKYGIIAILFGASDKVDRMRIDLGPRPNQTIRAGIGAGIGGGQWELHYTDENERKENENLEDETDDELDYGYTQVGWSSSIGTKEVKFISIQFSKGSLIRLEPTFTLRDLDESSFLFRLNRGLAEKVSRIHVYANEYKLLELARGEVAIDGALRPSRIPVDFLDSELRDPWVYIRPERSTWFMLRFSEQTPHRLFAPRETENSLRESSRQ
ncbi:hypothetical protein BH10PLA2_BH10PLA2_36500 [soil metagenome]